MSGEVLDFKKISLPFGYYCQVHEEKLPRNSLASRTIGAISLGPRGNTQGGQKFFTLLLAGHGMFFPCLNRLSIVSTLSAGINLIKQFLRIVRATQSVLQKQDGITATATSSQDAPCELQAINHNIFSHCCTLLLLLCTTFFIVLFKEKIEFFRNEIVWKKYFM